MPKQKIPKNDSYTYRASLEFQPQTIREEDRSVEFVLSTEDPVEIYSYDHGYVDEVLLSSGMEMPKNRQVPLLDTHDRSSVTKILGSVREIRTESLADGGSRTVGRVYFSRNNSAFEAWRLVKEGHLTDGSVGYEVRAADYIPAGERVTIQHKAYNGPVLVTSEWRLKEYSLAPIGADEGAKSRADTDEEVNEQSETIETAEVVTEAENTTEVDTMEQERKDVQTPPQEPKVDKAELTRKAKEEAERAYKARATEIMELCRAAGVPEMAGDFIASDDDIKTISRKIIDLMTAKKPEPTAVNVEMGRTAQEKTRDAMLDGLLMRSNIKVASPAEGANDFRGMSLLRMAEAWLQLNGVSTRHLTANKIVDKALGLRGEYVIASGADNFANILRDAQGKVLQTAYQEAPRQWSRFCSVVDVPDFKTNYRPQLSEFADLDEIPEKGAYEEGTFNDAAESYAISTYGRRFTLSRKALINDDLNAFNRAMRAMGDAAGRKVEQIVFAIFTANAAMSDGNNLFDNTNHLNNPTAAALSATSFAAARTAMRNQVGDGEDSSTAYLDIMPEFLIVPTDLEFTARLLMESSANPEADLSSGVINPARGMCQVIPSPILSANSSTAWYLAAGPNRIGTIEVGFLQGTGRSPELFEADQVDPDGRVYHVRLDVGAKALDWRGLL